MSVEAYKKGLEYEIFMRKAYSKGEEFTQQNLRIGLDESVFQNLIRLEEGDTIKVLGTFDKHFLKVKDYISKGLSKISKKKPSVQSEIKKLIDSLVVAKTSSDLLIIIRKGIEL
ncbi:MAG: hypothetical protein ACPGVH_03985 [Chitinophagales bacterium]